LLANCSAKVGAGSMLAHVAGNRQSFALWQTLE
jgi:hypothetical protein